MASQNASSSGDLGRDRTSLRTCPFADRILCIVYAPARQTIETGPLTSSGELAKSAFRGSPISAAELLAVDLLHDTPTCIQQGRLENVVEPSGSGQKTKPEGTGDFWNTVSQTQKLPVWSIDETCRAKNASIGVIRRWIKAYTDDVKRITAKRFDGPSTAFCNSRVVPGQNLKTPDVNETHQQGFSSKS